MSVTPKCIVVLVVTSFMPCNQKHLINILGKVNFSTGKCFTEFFGIVTEFVTVIAIANGVNSFEIVIVKRGITVFYWATTKVAFVRSTIFSYHGFNIDIS